MSDEEKKIEETPAAEEAKAAVVSEETEPEDDRDIILDIKDLDITFKTSAGPVHAIRGVNIRLHRGETVAIVGESGSGKSVTMKAAAARSGFPINILRQENRIPSISSSRIRNGSVPISTAAALPWYSRTL